MIYSISSATHFAVSSREQLTFSAIRAVSLALGKVVLMLSWCNNAETRFLFYVNLQLPTWQIRISSRLVTHLNRAYRCDGVRWSFLSLRPCFILLYTQSGQVEQYSINMVKITSRTSEISL